MPLTVTLLSLAVVGCAEDPGSGKAAGSGGTGLVIVSPGLAMIARDLGHPDPVIGRHAFDSFTDSDVPVVGDQTALDYEVIVRLDPSDVVLEESVSGVPPRLRTLAEKHDWDVHEIPLLTLGDVRSAILRMDELTAPSGAEPPTQRAQSLLDRWDAAFRAREGVAQRLGSTLILMGTNPPGAMGPGSFHYDMLADLGANPLPEGGAAYVRMTVEDVVRMDPDSIVLLMPGLGAGKTERALGALAGKGLSAEQNGRIIVVGHDAARIPGTSLIEVAEIIATRAQDLPPLPTPAGANTDPE